MRRSVLLLPLLLLVGRLVMCQQEAAAPPENKGSATPATSNSEPTKPELANADRLFRSGKFADAEAGYRAIVEKEVTGWAGAVAFAGAKA